MAQVSYGTITVSDLTDGFSALTIYLYQRSVNTPNVPNNSPVYYFSSATLNPSPNNSWKTSLSLIGEGSDPIWVTTAVVNSIETTVTLSADKWSTPIKLAVNGINGEPGDPGIGIKEVEELYYLQTQALYIVTYQYSNAPAGAPALPAQASYLAGETVTIAPLPSAVTGYTFSGWKRGNTVVTGTFSMPEENVVLIGTWTPSSVPTYTVTYQYTNAPSGATPPAQQSYQQNATVTLPTPSSVSGYTFNGWTSSQVTINNNTFTMPAYAVTVTGSWSSVAPSSDVVVTNLSKTLTTASNSIQFTGLSGEPTSFSILAGGTLATGASPWKTAMVVYDGTKVIGQTIRNTNNAQVTYDSTGFSKIYNNGTLTVTGTSTNFQANVVYYLIYTYNGTSNNIKTKTVQVGSGATTITFTNVEVEPEYFSCIFTSNFSTSSGYQRVIGVCGQGGDAYGLEMDSSAKYSSGHWSYSYSGGSLTISSSGTNQGGYFHQPGYYQLTYVVHNANLTNSTNSLRSGNSTKGQEITEGLDKSEIEEIVLTKGATLRAGASSELDPPLRPQEVVNTTEDVIDEWTLTIPTYRENKEGTYYSCFQIFYDDDITVNWTNPIKNDALNKSIEALDKSIEALDKSIEALEIAEETEADIKLLNGAFIHLDNSPYPNTPSGAGVVQGLLDSYSVRKEPSQWGFNTWIAANGIQIRKAETVLSSWAVDSNTNRATIQLGRNNNERFVISSDKLEAYGYVNNTIQKYFEVGIDGIKYGTSGIEVASKDDVNNIQIGGRNLLRNSQDYTDWTIEGDITFTQSEPTYIADFPTISSMSTHQMLINTYKINYSEIRNKHCMFSMLAKADLNTTISIMWQYEVYNIDDTNRLRYNNKAKTIVGTGKWETVIFDLDVTDSIFTIVDSGSSTPDYDNCEIRMSVWRNPSENYRSNFQLKNLKLEVGNKVTDWSFAPEDMPSSIGDVGDEINQSFNKIQGLINANLSLFNDFKRTVGFEDWLSKNGNWIQVIDGEAVAEDKNAYYELIEFTFNTVSPEVGSSVYKLFIKQNNVYEPILDEDAIAQSGITYYSYNEANDSYLNETVTVNVTNVYGLYTRNSNVYRQILDTEAVAQSGSTYYELNVEECSLREVEPGITRVYGNYILDLVETPLSIFLKAIIEQNENGIVIQGINNDTKVQVYSNGITLVRDGEMAFFGESIRLGKETDLHIELLPQIDEEPPKLGFYNGISSEPVAFMNSNALSIANGILTDSLQIGQFAWKKLGLNRITLVYTG